MRLTTLLLAAVVVCGFALSSCGGKSVSRTDRDQGRDLSGNWNDTDSRLVAEKITNEVLKGGWIDSHITAKSKKPMVQVGRIIVETSGEVINTDVFAKEIRNALLNSGRVRVRSSTSRSGETRDILKDQDKHASADTKKEMFNEKGSDFVLTGTINTQNDQEGRKKDKTYAVDMELRSVESQEIVWAGRKQITKQVDRSFFR